MKFKFLQANHGDAILISVPHDGKTKNVLIDGGPGNAYWERDRRTGRMKDNALKKELDEIIESGNIIDLLVLTHVDDDHIDGLIKWISSKEFKSQYISEVWFNSGQSIHQHFLNKKYLKNNLVLDYQEGRKKTGITQGDTFEDLLLGHQIWDRKIIKAGQSYERFGMLFEILSPTDDKLRMLLTKWKKESKKKFTGVRGDDYGLTIDELNSNDRFKSDRSKHNGSSIAFVLKYKKKNYLFTGDAHAGTLVKELRKQKYSSSKPLRCEFFKVSHHGSKANTNKSLLKIIETENYVICANGNHHYLPNKRCLARIIKNNTSAKIYFNYPQLISKMFNKEELENAKFELLGVDEL
ncbi:MAG: hypothetical protein N4A74_15290 [Carboxylicivirga sp.]|jgi:beta-lactamase superfamily II metal-dependent hydrolase|nr:hypothetical protein [Carboxylicivirga sp.]